jgi:tetratricopeptide (TPR) repeat protein
LPAPTTRRSLRRAQRPRALYDKGLSLYNLDRKDEALNLYDKIARRKAKGPAQRGVAAKALFNKGFLLCELDRKDEALAVCYEFLRYRFGEDNEPELRGMVEGILSAKKTSLASSRACPPAWDLPNELRNTAQPRPEILSGKRAPDLCSLLPPPYRKRPQQVLEL